MGRRKPVRHKVRTHKREGTPVRSFIRGSDTTKDHLVGDPPDWRYGSKPAIIPEVITFLEGEM